MGGVPGLRSRLRLVEAVEHAPVVEELDVGVVPALRDRGYREDLDLGEFSCVPLAHGRVDRAVDVLGDDLMPLFGVESLEVRPGCGLCAVALQFGVVLV